MTRRLFFDGEIHTMRKLITAATSVALGAGLLLGGAPAAQAAQAAPAQAGTSGVAAAAPKAKVKITYPKRIRRGGNAVYTWRVTGLKRFGSDAVVLSTHLPKNLGHSFRFLSKPKHSTCGFQKKRWVVYCIVRLRGQNTAGMKFRVILHYKYAGWYRADHYATPIIRELLPGGSVRDYLNQVSRQDRIGQSRTLILNR